MAQLSLTQLVFVFVAVLYSISPVFGIRFRDCGSRADFDSVKVVIPGCETTTRCDLIRGQNASIRLDFQTGSQYPGSGSLQGKTLFNHMST